MAKYIKGIQHVAIKCGNVDNFNKVTDFYTNVLELDTVRTWTNGDGSLGAMLDTGNGLLEICSDGDPKEQPGGLHHLALYSDDVDGCVAQIKAAGYDVLIGPEDLTIPSNPPYVARAAFLFGPLGEAIELFDPK